APGVPTNAASPERSASCLALMLGPEAACRAGGVNVGVKPCACDRATPTVPQATRMKSAEGVGFEPTEALRLQRFSRPPHSTALPPLRSNKYGYLMAIRGFANEQLMPISDAIRKSARLSRDVDDLLSHRTFLGLRLRHGHGPAERPPAFRRRRTMRYETHQQYLAGSLSRHRP